MSIMAISGLLTRADLDALPDDGLRHELIDGTFVMSPSPGTAHQRMAFALARALHDAVADTELEVLMAPFDVLLGPNVVEPDVIVAPRVAFTERDLPTPRLLAIEVRSPSTGWLDQGRKRTLYEEHGVTSYWLADPTVPSITILELHDGHYVEVTTATGDMTVTVQAPARLALNPTALARG